MKKESSAGIVVYRNDKGIKYLLLHYAAGHWDFPKGHLEEGEENLQAALREVKEETGLTDILIQPRFSHTINYYFKQSNQTIFKEVVFFLGEAKTNQIAISKEHIGFAWLSYEKTLSKVTFKNAKELLGKAQEFLLEE